METQDWRPDGMKKRKHAVPAGSGERGANVGLAGVGVALCVLHCTAAGPGAMRLHLNIIGRAAQVAGFACDRADTYLCYERGCALCCALQGAAPQVEVSGANSRLCDLKRAIEAAEGIPEVSPRSHRSLMVSR